MEVINFLEKPFDASPGGKKIVVVKVSDEKQDQDGDGNSWTMQMLLHEGPALFIYDIMKKSGDQIVFDLETSILVSADRYRYQTCGTYV